MGQAALDLPDPLETRPPADARPGSAAGADELLSQLAGDEINRLLAEADLLCGAEASGPQRRAGAARPSPTASAPAPSAANGDGAAAGVPPAEGRDRGPTGASTARAGEFRNSVATATRSAALVRGTTVAASAPGADPALDTELDSLVANLGAAAAQEPAAPTAPAADSGALAAVELAELPPTRDPERMIQVSPPSASVGAAPAEAESAAPPGSATKRTPSNTVTVLSESDPLVSAELDQVFERMTVGPHGDSERRAETADPDTRHGSAGIATILDPVVARDAEAAEADAASKEEKPAPAASNPSTDARKERRAKALAKVIGWMNAPWAAVPQPLLDAAGKLAILTLINAAAVLLYVLLFRR